ncbi:MAG: 50S ribosomal protein L29 [Gammaproteobacteria bacterium]|nr:50S ribosomal protein L29 [Gammaproteobacteria bacterium]|tara:strand:- start:8680 stop:8886 length:207 start_codon:yes stop_codon:yes gene_type:complete
MSKELIDLRKKNLEKLDSDLMSAREAQFGLRIKHRTGQLNETSELKKVRKQIAQIKTVINEIKSKDAK